MQQEENSGTTGERDAKEKDGNNAVKTDSENLKWG
jgi:hypothetical protein